MRTPGWAGYGDLTASLALCFPIAFAYGIGALLVGSVSAVDMPTQVLWRLAGHQRDTYLLMYAGIAVGFLWWLAQTKRRAVVSWSVVAPLLMESAIYALSLAAVIDLVLSRVLGLSLDVGGGIVTALGAGLHEELLFRLVGFAGGASLLRWSGVPPRLAWLVALAGTSLLFSAAHHWVGEPWQLRVFAFRAVAGVAFGLLFWFRSLAHAVWAHALYDIYVIAMHS